jgi:hypothetical protein
MPEAARSPPGLFNAAARGIKIKIVEIGLLVSMTIIAFRFARI